MKKIFLNWKQNGNFKEILNFKNNVKNKNFVLLLPFPYLSFGLQGEFEIGAQDVSPFKNGSFTGEVGSLMLKENGAKFCLVGHSERRMFFNETESMIKN